MQSTTDIVPTTTVRLPDATRDALGAELVELPNPEGSADGASARLHQVFAGLPLAILQQLIDFGRHTDTAGVMLVDNLPEDPALPSTPDDGGPSRSKETFVAEGVLLGLSDLLGEPVAFLTEKDGRVVHDIVPTEAGAATQTSQGSAVDLNFHNDIVHDVNGRYDVSNPDFLVLSCLRSDRGEQAFTYYADVRDILACLDEQTVEVLRTPSFRLNAPGGYCRMFADGKQVLSDPIPIVTGPAHAPEVAIAANGVAFETSEASAAFDRLQEACRDPAVMQTVMLRPGQALLINNRKGVHARSHFAARYDGLDRWLQRTYIRRSLWNIRDRAVDGSRRVHR